MPWLLSLRSLRTALEYMDYVEEENHTEILDPRGKVRGQWNVIWLIVII